MCVYREKERKRERERERSYHVHMSLRHNTRVLCYLSVAFVSVFLYGMFVFASR